MADVFVSYAHEDRPRVERLVTALEGAGLSVFWSKRLRSGWIWRKVLEREIRRAPCMVVVWSAVAIASEWVVAEADLGWKLAILTPARIDPVEPPLGLNSVQFVDLVEWTGDVQDARWVELLTAVREKVAVAAAAAATDPSAALSGARPAGGGPAPFEATDSMVASGSQRRRRFLIGGGAAVLAALPAIRLIRRFRPRPRTPRFRSKQGAQSPRQAVTTLGLGFYRNPSSEVVHYVSRAWYPRQQRLGRPNSGPKKPPRKHRRKGHEAPRLRFLPVARAVTLPMRNSEELIIRDADGIAVTRLERVDESRLPAPRIVPAIGPHRARRRHAKKGSIRIGAAVPARRDAAGKVPHVVYRRASFSFEQAAILHLRAAAESAPGARGRRIAAALDLLLNGIAHDLAWKKRVKGRPSYRLLDLAAAAAVHYDKKDVLAKILGMLEPAGDKRLADRKEKWNDESSEWWLRVKKGPIKWAGLPT